MAFYERFEQLCEEKGLKTQSKEIQEIAGVSSPAIQGWKDKSVPKITPVIKLAKYFDVSVDYLLDLSSVRKSDLSKDETLLIEMYRTSTAEQRNKILLTYLKMMQEGLK